MTVVALALLSLFAAATAQFSQSGASTSAGSGVALSSADAFGTSLSATTDSSQSAWVVSGAQGATRNGVANAGAAHLLSYTAPSSLTAASALPALAYVSALTPTLGSQAAASIGGESYGCDIAISSAGNVIAVGAMQQAQAGAAEYGVGRVYVFSGNRSSPAYSMTNTALLTPSDGVLGDQFGSSVAVSADGSIVLACSLKASVQQLAAAGACYVFLRGQGQSYAQVQKVVSSTPRAGAQFGGNDGSVALSSNGLTAIIGAPYDTAATVANAGSAYFVTATANWASYALKTLPPAAPVANSLYGWMVSINSVGSLVACGAAADSVAALTGAGSVTAWSTTSATPSTTSTWASTRLTASDASAGANFAAGLAFSTTGNALIVGANLAGATQQGAVYTFTLAAAGSSWVQDTPVLGPTSLKYSPANSNYGYNVKLSGDGLAAFASATTGALAAPPAVAAGVVYSFSKAISCPAGAYNVNGGSATSSCLACPANTYSSAAASACTACPTGTTSATGSVSSSNCLEPSVPGNPSTPQSQQASIIGGVLGGIGFLVLLGALYFFVIRPFLLAHSPKPMSNKPAPAIAGV